MSGVRIRNKRRGGFAHIPNETARDPELGLSAKGLLLAMLSLPDDWEYNLTHLETLSRQGREATRNAMKELITAGYVTRTPARGPGGKMAGWDYEVSDIRPSTPVQDATTPTNGKPVRRLSRQAAKPGGGKPATTKKELTKKEVTKKEVVAPTAPKPPQPYLADHHHPPEIETSKVLRRHFGRLLDTLLEEVPARRAWLDLTPAHLATLKAAAEHTQGGTYQTRLKLELDNACRISTAATVAGGGPADKARAAELARRQAAATTASEQAFDQALSDGRDPDAAAAAAYAAALADPQPVTA